MSDNATTLDVIEATANALDALEKLTDEATDNYLSSEETWLEKFDLTAEELLDQYRGAGRKTDPAEHTILAAARRAYPAEYRAYRRAKKQLDSIQQRVKAKTAALSGRQTQVKIEGDLARFASGPQPQWSGQRAA